MAPYAAVHQSHARTEEALRDIESGIYLSGIYVRDFLLNLSRADSDSHRKELLEIRASMDQDLKVLSGSDVRTHPKLVDQLRREVAAYWDSLEPIFTWTPVQKIALSTSFLRGRVLRPREAVLQIAAEAKALNAADLAERQRQLDQRHPRLPPLGPEHADGRAGPGAAGRARQHRRCCRVWSAAPKSSTARPNSPSRRCGASRAS